MMETMRAAIFHEHGPREVVKVEDVEMPACGAGDVLVRVEACGLNHLDVFVRRGMPGFPIALPHVSGGDVAGVIERVGPAVEDAHVGDRVLLDPHISRNGKHAMLGETAWGGLCEYIAVPATAAIRLPAEVTFEQAASLPVAYGTAWRMMLTRAQVTEGERVVVLGASGGVGVACVQIGKLLGAEVIAVASSEEKLARLQRLGADRLLNYAAEPEWHRAVRAATDGAGADVVVDFTGEPTWPRSLKAAAKGGRVVTCGATAGYEAVTDLRFVWTREISILGSNGWQTDDLTAVVDHVRRGLLEPVIDRVLALEDVVRGHALLEDRQVFGKLLVKP